MMDKMSFRFASLLSLAVVGASEELLVPLPGGGEIAFSTRGASAFHLRILRAGVPRAPIRTPMVHPAAADSDFTTFNISGVQGIQTGLGSLGVTAEGVLIMKDVSNRVIVTSDPVVAGSFKLDLSASSQGKLYGRGASPQDAEVLTGTSVNPMVANRGTYVPYYWSSDGYGALGVVAQEQRYALPANYSLSSSKLHWTFNGDFEMYLMPSDSLFAGTVAYYGLIGSPAVPPRYAFGFLASRWGWENREYIEETIEHFRSGGFPIDAIICDFEWFTNVSDYGFEPHGETWYHDFGFNKVTYPEPKEQLANYKEKYGIRVGGIRKPRLGNTDFLEMARSKNWILPFAEPGGAWPPESGAPYAEERNLDFRQSAVREWYAEHIGPLLETGMSFWWNDEGETDYWTFFWWNMAQRLALHNRSQTKRFYSINRAFSPGMARLGATVWTGDINAQWGDLQQTPGMMLNWGLAGAPYVACDTGGFNGNTTGPLLSRWMQMAAFMPTMRVHSTLSATPHWPWLFGDEAAAAIKKALELRYRLLPYHYSLAHGLHSRAELWMRPLVMDFPEDETAAQSTSQWLDGKILVAPVVSEDSSKNIYLPAGLWYPLGELEAVEGPTNITGTAAFDEIPAFVKAGAIVTLAPVIQYTDQLPGDKPLEVQVYAGQSGMFTMVEDDGESTAYEAGHVRSTRFEWDDKSRTLSWAVSGDLDAPKSQGFTLLVVRLFERSSANVKESAVQALGRRGSVQFSEEIMYA